MKPGRTRTKPSRAEGSFEVWTVVVAGGSGQRYGRAKQFEVIAGRTVLDWSVAAARTSSDGVVVVVPADDVLYVADSLGHDVVVVAGGDSRADSVRSGVAATPDSADVILVHDAARPAVSERVFSQVIGAVVASMGDATDMGRPGASVGVVPVVAVTDSLRHPDDGAVDRSELRAVQTPQGFPAAALRAALAAEGDATDDATLFERFGGTIQCVEGDPINIKLTHPIDQVTLAAALTYAAGAFSEETK